MVLQNVDELFEREELSAAPDIGWPDCFNSGVFVFEPSLQTFSNLIDLARQRGSFDGVCCVLCYTMYSLENIMIDDPVLCYWLYSTVISSTLQCYCCLL